MGGTQGLCIVGDRHGKVDSILLNCAFYHILGDAVQLFDLPLFLSVCITEIKSSTLLLCAHRGIYACTRTGWERGAWTNSLGYIPYSDSRCISQFQESCWQTSVVREPVCLWAMSPPPYYSGSTPMGREGLCAPWAGTSYKYREMSSTQECSPTRFPTRQQPELVD